MTVMTTQDTTNSFNGAFNFVLQTILSNTPGPPDEPTYTLWCQASGVSPGTYSDLGSSDFMTLALQVITTIAGKLIAATPPGTF